MSNVALDFCERITFSLRDLYNRWGYRQYRMSKFEEYDLYARNKDFLIADGVITFTDTNGKLMALKPDVTLSIVKNSADMPETVQKLYYNESIYRVAKGSGAFRETPQVGLECLGKIDTYCISEVLLLAAETLRLISEDSVLVVSHLGLLDALLNGIQLAQKDAILKAIGEKNLHELTDICRESGVEEEKISLLQTVLGISGSPQQIISKLQSSLVTAEQKRALEELRKVMEAFYGTAAESSLRLDFSVVDDVHYYNGIVFKGFVRGIPNSVLSGGQYDKLMRKMHRCSGAIGFAVYMDTLERLDEAQKGVDADILLLYGQDADPAVIREKMLEWTQQGISVMAQPQKPENMQFGKVCRLQGSEVITLENNA